MDLTWINYIVGLMISIAAWFVFLWAIRDGQFREPEETARRMLENETGERKSDAI